MGRSGERRQGDVASMIVRSALQACLRAGLDVPRARQRLKGVPAFGRVPWDDVAELCEQIDAACGGDEVVYRKFAAAMSAHAVELRGLAAAAVDAETLLRLVFAISSWAYPAMLVQTRFGRRRVELTLKLPRWQRSCAAYFRLSPVCTAYTLTMLGLPPCKYESRPGPRGGSYTFMLPPSKTVAARGRHVARRLRLQGLEWFQLAQLEFRSLWSGRKHSARTADIEAWGLTPRERDVLVHLTAGLQNKDIAAQLGCAPRTVEIHVTHILRKSGTSGRTELVARVLGE